MLDKEAVVALIKNGMDVQELSVDGDGYHYELTVVSDAFENKRTLARQQMVYALLSEEIKAGNLHALTIKTMTPTEREGQ
jgi:acid stress-induced BolA-like protein IbaG/YrbA